MFCGLLVEQVLFSILPSILTFEFDLILGLFLLGPLWAIFGVGLGFKNWFRLYSCS